MGESAIGKAGSAGLAIAVLSALGEGDGAVWDVAVSFTARCWSSMSEPCHPRGACTGWPHRRPGRTGSPVAAAHHHGEHAGRWPHRRDPSWMAIAQGGAIMAGEAKVIDNAIMSFMKRRRCSHTPI
jgi:hypothetical protein